MNNFFREILQARRHYASTPEIASGAQAAIYLNHFGTTDYGEAFLPTVNKKLSNSPQYAFGFEKNIDKKGALK